MTDRLDEIKARLDKATPGPWKSEQNTFSHDYDIAIAWDRYHPFKFIGRIWNFGLKGKETAELIANCPSDIAWLISELEKERAKAAELPESFAYFLEEKSSIRRLNKLTVTVDNHNCKRRLENELGNIVSVKVDRRNTRPNWSTESFSEPLRSGVFNTPADLEF